MVIEYIKDIKEILTGLNIIELDKNVIAMNGVFLVFDGIKTKEDFKSNYFFSVYIASSSLSRDSKSLYPMIEEVYEKFKNAKKKCRKLNIGVLAPFDISKLKIYRLEISFEE